MDHVSFWHEMCHSTMLWKDKLNLLVIANSKKHNFKDYCWLTLPCTVKPADLVVAQCGKICPSAWCDALANVTCMWSISPCHMHFPGPLLGTQFRPGSHVRPGLPQWRELMTTTRLSCKGASCRATMAPQLVMMILYSWAAHSSVSVHGRTFHTLNLLLFFT